VTALLLPAPDLPVRPAGVPVLPHVFGDGHLGDDATARLAGLIEPEFLAEAGWDPGARTLSPRADHRLLGWAVCQVAACGNKVDAIGGTCQACRRRRGTGEAPGKTDTGPACPAGTEPGVCAVKGCERVTRSMRQPLCESHRRHRGKLGLAVAEFVARRVWCRCRRSGLARSPHARGSAPAVSHRTASSTPSGCAGSGGQTGLLISSAGG